VVDRKDPSFKNPTKPIGPFYSKKTAEKLMSLTGETYIEDAGRGYRKVVASPKPIDIVEIQTIKDLLETGHIVIAGGGGGIPVSSDSFKGMPAVIDKDLLCSLMASKLKADKLIILTNVKQAQINYNTKDAQNIGVATVAQMKKYINEKQFAKGSMLPKVQAAINFVEATGNTAIITALNNLEGALQGQSATIIKK
jgi:carbamate kinase